MSSFFNQGQQPQQSFFQPNMQTSFSGQPTQIGGGTGGFQQAGFPAQGQQQNQFATGGGQPATDKLDQEVQMQANDTVSVIKFSPNVQAYAQQGQLLAVALWDGNVMVWSTTVNAMAKTCQVQPRFCQNVQCPVLGMNFQVDQPAILLACADNTIKRWCLSSNQVMNIGQHNAPVKDVFSVLLPQNQTSIVISCGWDAQVKFWAWANPQQLQCQADIYVAMPVHYASCVWPLLVTAHQQRLLHVWDLENAFRNNNFEPSDLIDSPLKFATSSLQCFADGKGFCVGSIEGRCSVKYYDIKMNDKNDSKSFCYKSHRKEDANQKTAECYQVNGFCFNKKYNTFYSYGGDGVYVSWNKDTRNKYRASNPFPGAIVAADQNQDGTLLAYAVGYDWSQGAQGASNPQIQNKLYVRTPDLMEIYRNK